MDCTHTVYGYFAGAADEMGCPGLLVDCTHTVYGYFAGAADEMGCPGLAVDCTHTVYGYFAGAADEMGSPELLVDCTHTVIPAKAGIQVTAAGMTPAPIDLSREPERALRAAAAALRAGGVVLVPTDTVYGLAALTPEAEEDLFVLKGRPEDRSIAVLVADRTGAESLAASVPGPLAELMDRHWPGPLTVVLPRVPTGDRPRRSAATATPSASAAPTTGGYANCWPRWAPWQPPAPTATAQQTPTHATEVLAALTPDHESDVRIAAAIDGGPCAGEASTVVTWQDGELKILRPGPLRLEPSN